MEHLDAIDRRHHGLIRDVVKEQLTHDPVAESRNRKPLHRPTLIGGDVWELRFGPGNRFRVFYRTAPAARKVEVLAVGVKEQNRLRIGGEEIQL